MARQQTIGKMGEDHAAAYLESLGWTILQRNWRYKKAEIDIIARDGEVLVFAEVKAKSYTYYGDPAESVSAYKERLILDASTEYMISIGYEWEVRYDIISIIFDKDKNPTLTHYRDAFFPSV